MMMQSHWTHWKLNLRIILHTNYISLFRENLYNILILYYPLPKIRKLTKQKSNTFTLLNYLNQNWKQKKSMKSILKYSMVRLKSFYLLYRIIINFCLFRGTWKNKKYFVFSFNVSVSLFDLEHSNHFFHVLN